MSGIAGSVPIVSSCICDRRFHPRSIRRITTPIPTTMRKPKM
jgi:hypothetical protein